MDQTINFYQIFKINPDGSIEPLRVVRIGGVQIAPGVRFGRGVSFGGIDLSNYIGRNFSAREENNVLILTGIF